MNKKIILGIIILLIAGFLILGTGHSEKNIKNITTIYGTNGTLDIGKGMYTEDTGVTEDTQVLAFDGGLNEGFFISTSKENAADLIQAIQSGTKCRDGDIVYYHLEDKELANSYSVFGGTHLKLDTVNSMDIGYLESPVSDEVVIVTAGPDTIVDCLNSLQWGNSK